MNIDLEDRLHHRLPELARRADLATVELDDVMGRVGSRRRRRAAARGAAAVCGLALLVGGLVAVNARERLGRGRRDEPRRRPDPHRGDPLAADEPAGLGGRCRQG